MWSEVVAAHEEFDRRLSFKKDLLLYRASAPDKIRAIATSRMDVLLAEIGVDTSAQELLRAHDRRQYADYEDFLKQNYNLSMDEASRLLSEVFKSPEQRKKNLNREVKKIADE